MWEYKIENSDLWYKIFRHPKWDDSIKEYYDVRWEWNTNKTYAKIFFHRDDAASALSIIRMKNGKNAD